MITREYVPSQCRGESPEFSGKVTLKEPTNVDLWEMFEDMGFDLDDEGKVKLAGKKGKLKSMATMVRAAEPFVESVAITHLASEKKYGSFDDLNRDRKTQTIIAEIAGVVFQGMGPSGN